MSHKKKRHVYPDVLALPRPVVDNHTHIPVHGEPGAADDQRDYGDAVEGQGRPLTVRTALERLRAANVRRVITCGCEVPTLEPNIALARQYPDQVAAAIAIHPNDAALHRGVTDVGADGMEHGLDPWHREYSLEDAVALVADLARDPHVVAIGETGLDYFRTADAGKAAQIESFRMHIELAKELELPLQIHDREAHADCLRVLEECGAPERTVFHCFSGDAEMARVLADHGWYASFAGPLTYPANETLREAFRVLPSELILAETDAPYLTPVPWRGYPNAAYAVAYTVAFQAQLRGVALAEWCDRVDANTREVYGI
ncbi:MAG: TatD family hydrolase [Ancrocorticia sp.]|nr:TatD family hydrolase [Ancrocorticia sp.]MCI1963840.1 TatD family hydrolase [Ancrocorticia sp.]MCI2002178.1 TatD family hydrolase [Ancrocorticia sp.]MCI2012876.1 TatD family hydrolase [Ancrocorticia sp.]MCI2029514.1 TatD family hydrolase [Ancrocorticia sp.]